MVWEVKKLGDVCEVIAGQSPEGKYYNKSGEGLPFYQGKKQFTMKYLGKPTTWTKQITKEAQKDDVLMSVRAPVGPINFSTQKICIGRGLAAIRANKLIDKDFLFNFLLNIQKELIGNDGAVFNSINKNQIENIKIPVPSLSTQKKIVKILDQAFEAIATAKENTEQNLKNAKEVFGVTLHKIFNNESYKKSELSNIANFQYGYTAKSTSEGKYRYVRITDISTQGLLNTQNKVYIPDFEDYKKYLLSENDLLMARTGASFGDVLLFEDVDPSIFASYLIRIKFEINLNPRVYWFFSKSKTYWDQARKLSSGSAQPHFNGKALGKIIFRYPESNIEQDKIILKMEKLNEDVKKLESIYTQKLLDLEELKQSILQKAFKGELTGGKV
jgi:type I restriction enzyme, S subunit